jgi:hypothetical protein
MSEPAEDTDVELIRRKMAANINSSPSTRDELAAAHGIVWDTTELQREFEVLGFATPFVVVRRRADGQKGSLMFQHHPRFYYGFQPDSGS